MAKFSQAFLQGLLQPTYQQGLFEAARGVGQLPAVVESERQRKQQLDTIKNITSVFNQGMAAAQASDLGGLNASIKALQQQAASALNVEVANSINEQITTLQSMVPETKRTASLNAINSIAATMDPSTLSEAELKIKNDKIIEIAVTNNIDITPYVGMHMQLISDRINYEEDVDRAASQDVVNKYIALTPSAREAYKKTPEGQKFSRQLTQADATIADAERSNILLEKAKDTGDYQQYAPRLLSSITSRLEGLEDGPYKKALEDEFETLKQANPKLTEGSTFTSTTDAKRIVNALETFNNRITSTVADNIDAAQRAESNQDSQRNAILNTTLSVTQAEVDRFIDDGSAEEALKDAEVEKEGKGYFSRQFYTETQIANKAREMAVQVRRDIAEANRPDLFDRFIVGNVYEDADGNRSVYQGNNVFTPVEG
jgi:hypothetical protein